MTPQAVSALVAHDVKNRLVILGEELARLASLPLSAEAQGHVAVATEQAMLVTSKLVEWLTMQRAQQPGGLRAVPGEEVPEFFLADMHEQALPLAGSRIELVKEQAADLPGVWFFDAQLVRLALDSALHNALRFAERRIAIGARMEKQQLCFYVRDDGPGVQSDPAATSTGLGTALCEQVAKAHLNQGRTGSSVLRNDARGGAIFELFLP